MQEPATGLWVEMWLELGGAGRVSLELDADRDRNITQASWGRARRAFGVPERIVVLDEATAARVRRAVPARVAVVVEDDPRLRVHADGFVAAPAAAFVGPS